MLLLFLIIHVAFEQFQGKIVLHGIFCSSISWTWAAGGLSALEKKKKKKSNVPFLRAMCNFTFFSRYYKEIIIN